MPIYEYKAKDGPVLTVAGELALESRAAVLAALERRGLVPVWVREKAPESRRGRRRPGRISFRDVTVATRQLASLTRSGVPILRALSTIAEQAENARLRRLVEGVEAAVRDGNMLSDALAAHPRQFSALYVNMVRAGESAGILDGMLDRLADAREREEDTRRKIQSATAYPLLVIAVGLATVFVLLAFFLPRVVGLFRNYDDLPLPTRILIGTSDFLHRYWYWLLLVAGLAAAVVARLAAIEKGRTFFDRIKLRLPLLGRFLRDAEAARFARTLSLLIEAGIPVDRALTLSADTVRNAVLRAELADLRARTVEQGLPLSDGLRRSPWFPPLVANMTAVGEESGRLETSLAEVAAYFEKECDHRGRLFTSLLEPILILCVGGMVAFIVASMLLPMFRIGFGL